MRVTKVPHTLLHKWCDWMSGPCQWATTIRRIPHPKHSLVVCLRCLHRTSQQHPMTFRRTLGKKNSCQRRNFKYVQHCCKRYGTHRSVGWDDQSLSGSASYAWKSNRTSAATVQPHSEHFTERLLARTQVHTQLRIVCASVTCQFCNQSRAIQVLHFSVLWTVELESRCLVEWKQINRAQSRQWWQQHQWDLAYTC